MEKLIAYCGLDCEKCDARIAMLNDDNALERTEWCHDYRRHDQLYGMPCGRRKDTVLQRHVQN